MSTVAWPTYVILAVLAPVPFSEYWLFGIAQNRRRIDGNWLSWPYYSAAKQSALTSNLEKLPHIVYQQNGAEDDHKDREAGTQDPGRDSFCQVHAGECPNKAADHEN